MSEFSSAGAKRLIAPYTVTDGRRFRLKDIKSNDTGPYTSKEEATNVLARGLDRLHTLQGTLYAEELVVAAAGAFRRWTRPARTASSRT